MRLAALLLAPALCAQAPVATLETPLSAAERIEALRALTEAGTSFTKAIEGLSPAQRAWKPAPERWSVDQCAEHITVTENLVSDLILGKLLPGPRDPSKRSAINFVDGKLLPMLQDRSHKATAPEAIAPKGAFKSQEALLAAYTKHHAALEEAVRTSPLDWRARVMPHPFLGSLDTYQWTLLAAGHTLRHVLQIEEVKNTPGFPKS